MKIAAYNLNSINARIENLTAWLAKAAPDVVLVQEIKSEYNNFPFFELRAAGYEAKMLGQKSYNGVAVLSRHPLSVVREGLPDLTTKTPDISKRKFRYKDKNGGWPQFICPTATRPTTMLPTVPNISTNWNG